MFTTGAVADFPAALASLQKPRTLFVRDLSSILYDPPQGRTAFLASLVASDTTSPQVTSSTFNIDYSKFLSGTSTVDVGVSVREPGGVARIALYISETASLDDAVQVDLTRYYDSSTGSLHYFQDGENHTTYSYWLGMWDTSGNHTKTFLGSRTTDNSGIAGSQVTVEDIAFTFQFSLV